MNKQTKAFELDTRALLGFDQISTANPAAGQAPAPVPQARGGIKTGAQLGAKLGAKLGGKAGFKPPAD